MFEVSVRSHFSAAHHLRNYPGQCSAVHGHNWEVEVVLRGAKLDSTGILVDFRRVKDALRKVLGGVDHSDLNGLDKFKHANPTSENIARILHRELSVKLNCRRYRVHAVAVAETPGNTARYQGSRS